MLKEGVKHDQGKPMFHLLPWECLIEVAKVVTEGADKYEPNNWKYIPDARNRLASAALRHISKHMIGEKIDEETGRYHLAHAISNLLFLLWFEIGVK